MGPTKSRQLVLLGEAAQLLAKANTIDDVKEIRDKAEAVRTFAKASKLGLELQNRAAGLKLAAERKAGSLLSGLGLRGGDRRSKRKKSKLKLEDLGISRDESSRWQLASSVPEKEFQEYVNCRTSRGEEITAAGLLRLATRLRREARNDCQSRSQGGRNGTTETGNSSHRLRGNAAILIEELSEHHRLLAQILEPLCDFQNPVADSSFLERGERRAIGHLLGEMANVIATLERELTALMAS